MKKTGVLLIALLVLTVAGLACGGDEEATATATREPTAPTATPTTIPPTPTATTIAPTPTPTTIPPTATSSVGDLDPVERGRLLAQQKLCQGCHSTDGSSKVGLTWKGLYGAATEL